MIIGFAIVEIFLRAFNLPHFYKQHTYPPQFAFLKLPDGNIFFVNKPSTAIRFTYDGNPRKYFGKENEIDHVTNSWGFRGPEFSTEKPEGVFRIAFLGDSFTFGEGVKFQDTYPEKVSEKLSGVFKSKGLNFQSYNFGVAGYNTEQELFLLKNLALAVKPDAVVVGYVLNDAEKPLWYFDKGSEQVLRHPVEEMNGEGINEKTPPETFLFKFRITRLAWKALEKEKAHVKAINYYKSLYEKDPETWEAAKKALKEIISICNDHSIPCYVVCFPVLHGLGNRYPFKAIHGAVGNEVKSGKGAFIDLFPLLKGRNATDLWVHPTDQHPNEAVHGIAAEAIAAEIMQDKRI